ncbi:MAG: 3-oxoacyl-ACP synthase III family protein [Planctomycetota bacterium]|jgi:3-oxoacyl-[acyl-carrier-protein] synthase-3
MTRIYSVITATGRYVPEKIIRNKDFLENDFRDSGGVKFDRPPEETIMKFEEIAGIKERRHVTDDLAASDIAYFSAKDALESSGTDGENLDYIIVAHNFGDVKADNRRSDFVPTLAARVKNRLGIENPRTIAYDVPFGCPGWLMGVIQANYYLKSGDAKRILVVGAETLSRISDPHDRDSMLYSDGAGATILEAVESNEPVGILSHAMRSDTLNHAYMLRMDRSYNPEYNGNNLFLKMEGHRLYKYAMKTVPPVVLDAIEKAGLALGDIKKVLLHQANDKMDWAILKRVFGKEEIPADIMPMSISWLGNSSVATLPTLLDLIVKGDLDGHSIRNGDNVIFASVGAGMNINAVIYKVP